MVKKVVTKTVTETVHNENSSGKISTNNSESMPKKKKMTAREREELLIENFVGLQHAMTNLSIKFGALSDNITRLLQVFEEAAKSYVQGGESKGNKDMLDKINSLLDQNKTIAKGLILMEGKLRGGNESQIQSQPEIHRPRPQPLPRL